MAVGRTELTGDCQAFRGVLGTKVVVLKPGEPEHKGIIERAHDYFERSFLPGRTFTGPGGFQPPVRQVAADRQRSAAPGVGMCTGRSDRRGPPGDAGAAAGAAAGGVAQRRPGWRAITTSGWTPMTTRCTRG